MKRIAGVVVGLLLVPRIGCALGEEQSRPAWAAGPPAIALMPRVEDYTLMGWAEEFPSHTPSAPWRRWISTGYYAMALDTDTMQIPHLGPVPARVDYAAAARSKPEAWKTLPPGELVLTITAGGKSYRCTAGGAWSQFAGPRLIESGRFLQRADVTDLVFTADDGERLNVEARFETAAWPDRLGLILAARPGLRPIPAGESCFGRVGGGFGLDGTSHLEIPHSPELDPERFTLEFWVFVPTDFRGSERTYPWLVCKNRHEETEGNFGILLPGDRLRATMNIGGGRENIFSVDVPQRPVLRSEAWNHLAISYDAQRLRLYVNGEVAGQTVIGRQRVPGRDGLAFGRRQDNCPDPRQRLLADPLRSAAGDVGHHFQHTRRRGSVAGSPFQPAAMKGGPRPASAGGGGCPVPNPTSSYWRGSQELARR